MGAALAKLVWYAKKEQSEREYVLTEGATATLGRSSNNDIQIAERYVSRQHAVIQYREGIFVINDLGSSNGTFVNEKKITAPFPLFAGDNIRLYEALLTFSAAQADDVAEAQKTGRLIVAADADGQGSLTITNGPQEGETVPLTLASTLIGRATSDADWGIMIQDRSVSRPHARIEQQETGWFLYDLDSRNGTHVNGHEVHGDGRQLFDGDTVVLGSSILLFRIGWEAIVDQPPVTSLLSDEEHNPS